MANINSFDAVGPAYRRMVDLLFKPFRFEHWLAFGLLCFVEMCSGLGMQSSCNGNIPSLPVGDSSGSGNEEAIYQDAIYLPAGGEVHQASTSKDIAEAKRWLREHRTVVVTVGILLAVLIVGLTVLFHYLGSRAVFAYVDGATTGRAEVSRPWREHAPLASSFFRWRLGWTVLVLVLVLLLIVPVAVWAYQRAKVDNFPSGEELLSMWQLWTWVALLIVFSTAVAVIDMCFHDFVAPLQFLHKTSAGPAIALTRQIITGHPGQFILYIIVKVLLAIAMGIIAAMAGLLTCCLGFLLMAIPVIGQAVLQPLWLFHRLFSLYFLQQLGHDLFAAAPKPQGVPPPL